ncbi:hypothetical protein CC86DRAFT_389938 [Ophiobolus disseminans]|uniref:Uncharacterized protein n=1 Tax=Ophiobolus disseminans TaxID=1469910 RepID=A0A6A7AKM7_9PLEO|nr:hypothetical protein CC86DRAFT_389938 [Ophiobolus disseminans]
MASGSATVPPGEGVAPLNFIYACSVCCYSFADVYEGHNETVKGLSDGINPKERLVTHLYLASCCHVFCGSHLDGGGPSFHPGGQRPKAPCPVCVREKGDNQSRDLYSIRGFQKDEHDPMIPSAWFTTPPISFEGNDRGTEALRFQYLALTRYCQNTHATRKPLQDALVEAQKKLTTVQDLASEEHVKVLKLQQENEQLKAEAENLKKEAEGLRSLEQEVEQYRRLDVNPKDLETFTTNKDAIRHYLKLVPMLMEQNQKMNKRLASLGFAMAVEPVPNFAGLLPNELDQDMATGGGQCGDLSTAMRKATSSHTAGRSAHTSGNPATTPSSPFMQRPMKRQRIDSPLPGNSKTDPPTSRDAMPPPRKPVSRMRSVRKMFPTLRKKFSSGRSTPTPEVQCSNGDDETMYGDEDWDDSTHMAPCHDQPAMQHGYRHEVPYMSGALPVERPLQAPNSKGSQLLSSIGVDSDRPDFTFRASLPVKMLQQRSSHQLPTEPSYIRLMDGLSRDDGIELGLRDPRDDRSSEYRPSQNNRQDVAYNKNERKNGDAHDQEWRSGLPSHDQIPSGPYRSVGTHLDSPYFTRAGNHGGRVLQPRAANPITPAARRHQQPSHQLESVVSSYVANNNHVLSRNPNDRIAEPQDSSNHFATYQSSRPRMVEYEYNGREPRGLNGLSFFESPVISRSQPIQHNHQRQQIDRPPPSQHYQSRNVNTSGFITRPEAGRSPFFRDSAYGSSREWPTPSQQQYTQRNTAIPFPSFNRYPSYSRTGHVPSTMPSIISGRSPVRTQPQWQGLQRMGVRSSRHEFSSVAGTAYANPTGNLFPSNGRRSVRR